MVYFIQAESTPYVKIGRTQSPIMKRLAGMKTGCPHDLKVVRLFPCGPTASAAIEKWLHKRFHKFRARGEWFTVTVEQIDEAMVKAAPMLSHFETFLDYLKAQKERRGWIGDLARDTDHEEESAGLSTFKDWREHLKPNPLPQRVQVRCPCRTAPRSKCRQRDQQAWTTSLTIALNISVRVIASLR